MMKLFKSLELSYVILDPKYAPEEKVIKPDEDKITEEGVKPEPGGSKSS